MKIIKILEKQAQVYKNILSDKLKDVKTLSEVYMYHSTIFKDFYSHAFKPMTDGERIKNVKSGEVNEMIERISIDIDIAHSQLDDISNRISESYNSNQDFKTGLKNRVEYLTSLLSDVNILLEEENEESIIFKDSLSNYDFVDKNFGSGMLANISTSEGIAILSIDKDEDITSHTTNIKVSGNGEAGNYHVIKKVFIETADSDYNIYAKEKSEEDPKNNPLHIADNQASTWFEYQMLGISNANRTKYRLDWGTANSIREELSLRVIIELDKIYEMNWIDITPYVPEKSNTTPILYSVKISTDGSQYVSVYENEVINENINLVPQASIKSTKLLSQGILSFPPTKAKFVEIIFKQDSSYNELLGTEYYTKTVKVDGEVITSEIIDPQFVPKEVIDGPVGIYLIK